MQPKLLSTLFVCALSANLFAQTGDSIKTSTLKVVEIESFKSANEKMATIGKLAVKPMDLPQSVATIDLEIMEQQQVNHVSDALKNFNGVYLMGASGGYQEEIAGRGFAFSSSNTFKNGIRYNNSIMPEVSGLERMEVMKGSAAILFGNVAAGGVINLVTKKPDFTKAGEVKFTTGSYDMYKPAIDVRGVIGNGKHLAYRMNTVYEKARSFRDKVGSERMYINPSFLFKLGDKLDLLVEADYLNDKRTADFGVGAINYQLIDIPRSQFLGVAWSYVKTEQKSITSTLTYHFNKNWEIRNVTSLQQFNNDLFANQRPNGNSQFIRANGNWIRGLQRTRINEEYSITQLDLTGRFKTWIVKHNLLFGADADQYYTNTFAHTALNVYDSINVWDLNLYTQRNDIPNLTVRTRTGTPIQRLGVYVQDLMEITKYVKLLAGVRYSYLETGSKVYTTSTQLSVDTKQFDNAFTPRFGLVIQPTNYISVFGSYANSFVPNKGVDINGDVLPASYIDQYEAGVKTDLFKGALSANLTVYQIKNSNLAQISLENGNTNTNIKELAGEVTSKGLEVDIATKAIYGVSIIAGYSYNDTRYTKTNTYIVGSRLLYNPANTANLTLNYAFSDKTILKGLSLNVGTFYAGAREAGRLTRVQVANDSFKPIKLPDYVLLDAGLGYTRKNVSFRLKVSNITNVLSYNVHDDNSVNPIAPRQVSATIGFKF